MNQNLENAKQKLLTGEYTCVLCCGDDYHTSIYRGVKPLVQWLSSGRDFSRYSAADKVIGRATAFLYLLLGIRSVYGHVISKPALEVFQSHGIHVEFGTLAENIINRKGDGLCPFEEAVLTIQDPNQAHAAILKKMEQMNITF